MTILAQSALWASIGLLVWVYAGYPVLAWAVGKLRPFELRGTGISTEEITVGIAVHNGAEQIHRRIADLFDNADSQPIEIVVASDGSTDGTAATVGEVAASDPRVKLVELARVGQSGAQARIFEAAAGAVVVLTDVETRFAPGCLAALVAPLADARVGCVTGVLRWHYDEVTHTARDEGLYWRYEQRVRAWESRAGWLTAGTGAILAVRRGVYRPAPAHASLDQMLPLYAREQGLVTVVAPDAIGSDRGTASPEVQRAARTRIATQGIEANLRMSLRIKPWRSPGAFLALWSHKILRWATPILAGISALAGIYLFAVSGQVLYLGPVVVGVATAVLAVFGSGFARTIVNVNVAFAKAWLNVVLRRRVGAWESR